LSKIITPIYNEDYEFQYGKIDYNNKIILDIGGANGDTSSFFISKGAIFSVSVDCNLDLINRCKQSVKELKIPILPIHKQLGSKLDWESLIVLIKPDVVKSDCEGEETNLFLIDNEVFKLVNEYIIETHTNAIFDNMVNKCKECNYNIIDVNNWTGEVRIVYAIKKS